MYFIWILEIHIQEYDEDIQSGILIKAKSIERKIDCAW